MTATDEQIVNAIDEYIAGHGYSPTLREIGEIVGIVSPGSMQTRLKRMRRDGIVTFDDTKPRTIRVV